MWRYLCPSHLGKVPLNIDLPSLFDLMSFIKCRFDMVYAVLNSIHYQRSGWGFQSTTASNSTALRGSSPVRSAGRPMAAFSTRATLFVCASPRINPYRVVSAVGAILFTNLSSTGRFSLTFRSRAASVWRRPRPWTRSIEPYTAT